MTLNCSIRWLLVSMIVFVSGETPPGGLKDPSIYKLVRKQAPNARSPKTYWPYTSSYSNSRLSYEDPYSTYPYGTRSSPVKSSPSQSTASSSGHSSYFSSPQEYWSPSSYSTWNTNHTNTRTYSRPSSSFTGSAGGVSYSSSGQGALQGSHSMFQYQQVRPTTITTMKKVPSYFPKTQLQIKPVESGVKPKYKKTNPVFYYNSSGYKKTIYPRVHKPHVMTKYPAKKTVNPLYRRYYQSPLQQYVVPSSELHRFKVKKPNGYSELGYYKTSEPTTTTLNPSTSLSRYHTTERMDETYPATSEDYAAYNETDNKSGNYYDTYEEVESTTLEPEESLGDETSTRGYYGDRIYMSTQTPLRNSEKTTIKNKYYIIRKSSADDIETIFE